MLMAEPGPQPKNFPEKRLLRISICSWECLLQMQLGPGTPPPSPLPIFRVWDDSSYRCEAEGLRKCGVKQSPLRTKGSAFPSALGPGGPCSSVNPQVEALPPPWPRAAGPLGLWAWSSWSPASRRAGASRLLSAQETAAS